MMEDAKYQHGNFKVFIKDGAINIQDEENNIFVGTTDGQRFQVLNDAISYLNAMMVLERLKKQKEREE